MWTRLNSHYIIVNSSQRRYTAVCRDSRGGPHANMRYNLNNWTGFSEKRRRISYSTNVDRHSPELKEGEEAGAAAGVTAPAPGMSEMRAKTTSHLYKVCRFWDYRILFWCCCKCWCKVESQNRASRCKMASAILASAAESKIRCTSLSPQKFSYNIRSRATSNTYFWNYYIESSRIERRWREEPTLCKSCAWKL